MMKGATRSLDNGLYGGYRETMPKFYSLSIGLGFGGLGFRVCIRDFGGGKCIGWQGKVFPNMVFSPCRWDHES